MNALTGFCERVYYYGYYGVANDPFKKKEEEKKSTTSQLKSSNSEDVMSVEDGGKKSTTLEKSNLEKLSDLTLMPINFAACLLHKLTHDARWISSALTLKGLYETTKFFYPETVKSLKKYVYAYLPSISKETAYLTAFILTATTIASIGLRSFARYSNKDFVKLVKNEIIGLKEKRQLAQKEKEYKVIEKEVRKKILPEIAQAFVKEAFSGSFQNEVLQVLREKK